MGDPEIPKMLGEIPFYWLPLPLALASIMHNGEKVLNNINTVPITQTIDASSTEKEIPKCTSVDEWIKMCNGILLSHKKE